MIKKIRIKLAEIKKAWHSEMIYRYNDLVESGRLSEEAAFTKISKHFIKLSEAQMYLVSVGKERIDKETLEKYKELDELCRKAPD